MFAAELDRSLGIAKGPAAARAAAASQDLVCRLERARVLQGHDGCVNTVAFSPDGQVLVSGSDDQAIILHNWQTGKHLLKWASGHRANVFQARILPDGLARTVVSCAADGQVRVAHLREGGAAPETRRLAVHSCPAHKLALEPGAPTCFYSCGEDGEVRHFDLRTRSHTKLLVCRPLDGAGRRGSFNRLELNSIHCNPVRPWQFAVAGGDAFVRVYDTRRVYPARTADSGSESGGSGAQEWSPSGLAAPVRLLAPWHMRNATERRRMVHITCAQFSCFGELVATYNDERIYLFAAEGASRGSCAQRPARRRAASTSPRPEERSPAKRSRKQPLGGQRRRSGCFGAAETVSSDDEAALEEEQRQDAEEGGDAYIDAPGVLPPDGDDDDEVLQRYEGHLNVQTVKGISFLGASDEYVVSGSDCGHMYIWDKASGALQAWHHGDTHVVNCLEPHPHLPLTLATSGIDSDVKIWTPTAAEPRLPGREAVECMQENQQQHSQRRSRLCANEIVITPAMLARLLAVRRDRARAARRSAPGANAEGSEDETEEEEESDGAQDCRIS